MTRSATSTTSSPGSAEPGRARDRRPQVPAAADQRWPPTRRVQRPVRCPGPRSSE
ncbi:hypothetical protein HBB16_14980 [Pseudonocardia sp. MCCB 268]|nr:hypothetical protein [Pseudonocardia cytotoxica]